MLATPAIARQSRYSGPRPLNVNRDTGPVLDLLDVVFGPFLDAAGRRRSGERVSFGGESPLWSRLDFAARGLVPGFVWEEDGRIVGNVTLMASPLPGRFLIANVAVHPGYRRRGIGRGVMLESISHIRRQHGREVLLQVEQANQGAIKLYAELGFATLGTMNHWEAQVSRLRPPALGTGQLPDIRPLAASEWHRALELDLAAIPADLNWPVPPSPAKYRSGLLRWLDDAFNGRKSEIWLARPVENGRGDLPAGLGSIRMEWGRPHRLELRIAPAWRGQQIERHLLAKLLRRLASLRRAAIQVQHPPADEATADLLSEANFQLRRSLTIMRLDLTGRPPGAGEA